MPPNVPLAVGQPYMNALGALATRTGDWIPIGDGLSVIMFEYVFDVGAGNVTATVSVQHTAQLNGTPTSGSVINLPLGSLHTSLSQATLASAPNPSVAVTLTATITGRFAIILGQVPAGQIRSIYTFGSGTGASPNTITCYASGWRS